MEQSTATDTGAAPNGNDNPQHSNENSQSHAPNGSAPAPAPAPAPAAAAAAAAAAAPLSLSGRAPAESIATRIWEIYMGLGLASVRYENRLEQAVQCIRSQLLQHSVKMDASHPLGVFSARMEYTKPWDPEFPYPDAFRIALGSEGTRWIRTVGSIEVTTELPTMAQLRIEQGPRPRPRPGAPGVNAAGGDSNRRTAMNTTTREVGFGVNYYGVGFEITRRLVTQREVNLEPMHVVIGIFPPGSPNPRKCVMFVHKPEHFFRKLHWGAYRLRGLGSTLFSLTRVREFRVYKCNVENGTHERVQLDKNGVMDLQLLLYMYNKWFVDGTTAQVWADWVHQVLNDGSNDVPNGTYGLELVLGWSATRISVVVILPVLLSLAVGLYLNSRDWSDLTTIQTAWGTASYVVTTGGLLAALLGILSSMETHSRKDSDKDSDK
ncbi:hypothetical protein F5X97DRAFT_207029 [Nemania serpens]|nr:hypothetical protein F5X97DRAFT_207029 [Nemania serpens]